MNRICQKEQDLILSNNELFLNKIQNQLIDINKISQKYNKIVKYNKKLCLNLIKLELKNKFIVNIVVILYLVKFDNKFFMHRKIMYCLLF